MQTLAQSQEDITKETEKKSLTDRCNVTGIYGLRNKVNGKWYVGQSIVAIGERWKEYKLLHCKGQIKLYNALKKYGYDSFDKIVLEECIREQSLLDSREDYWIRHYDSVDQGYNCRYGGSRGKMSEEAKNKIKEWNNRPENRESRRNHVIRFHKERGHPSLGLKHTIESREKMAAHDRSGSKSPSFGRMWINNGIDNKKILKENPIPDGYKKGRLYSFRNK